MPWTGIRRCVKLAGGKLEQKLPLDGLDIWPVLTQGAKSPHDALLLCGTRPGQAALRMGDWKLLASASEVDAEESEGTPAGKQARGKAARVSQGMELYNLAEDTRRKEQPRRRPAGESQGASREARRVAQERRAQRRGESRHRHRRAQAPARATLTTGISPARSPRPILP